ncbi:MAG: tRNA (adenosine(37)-N6)-threonylcarbamoyltransferase complex dimerization subunit type 1 TsaB [Actinobacteria bacterium HGW-Actinobacteria-7]|nr:MAG: tRNA (adenosine(37)-N6)-threonylcarbamoyltransferase complex dimerization subunit type 1 TsaB [Actinobacteria bacterium HGW-Actinobacteria-7]
MSRLLIALDTATEAVGYGVARLDGTVLTVIESGCEVAPRRANTLLLTTLSAALERAGERVSDVGGVVVGRGPGSFTGVRIGVATAKGLAQGLGVPLAGVGTLDALAWQVAATGYQGMLGLLGDAMRGEVYPVLFRCEDGCALRLTPDRVAKPDVVAESWASELTEPLLLCGNGLAKYREVFSAAFEGRVSFSDEASWWTTGAGLFAALGGSDAGAVGSLEQANAATLLPIYTRLSDAEENERLRTGPAEALPDNGVAGGGERA